MGGSSSVESGSRFEELFIAKILRLVCGITGLALSILGLFSILGQLLTANVPGVIISIYMIPIGLLIAIAELRWNIGFVFNGFPFLRSYFGRGFFYIFVGTLALGIFSPWGYIAGAVLIINGICSLIASFMVKEAPQDASSSYAVSTSQSQTRVAIPDEPRPTTISAGTSGASSFSNKFGGGLFGK
mmetsp:Transcript_22607/g.37284  ORF Transcript_22607/g.37284 Transcript_22607/m.37284 type:complete len:186 (-) Transcript_22607:416-973(-)